MAKQPVSLKFEPETLDRIDQLAEQEGSSRQALVDRGIVLVLDGAKEDTKTLRLSVSQIQCLDQLAERAGISRIDLMSRYLGERLRREFVDARNAKLQEVTRASV